MKTATLTQDGLLVLPDANLFLVVTTPIGKKPLFRARIDCEGCVHPVGEPIFDVRWALAAPDNVGRIVDCLKLRCRRQAKGWTQRQAATALGMSRVYYNYLEMGRFPVPRRVLQRMPS